MNPNVVVSKGQSRCSVRHGASDRILPSPKTACLRFRAKNLQISVEVVATSYARCVTAVTLVTLFSGSGERLTPGNLFLHPAGVEQLFPVLLERDLCRFKVVGKATEDDAFRNRTTQVDRKLTNTSVGQLAWFRHRCAQRRAR
jgi:hypothetical protein